MSIIIDSVTYSVPITKINIAGQFLYKYKKKTKSGTTKSEGIGFLENQSISFAGNVDSDFVALYEELSTLNTDGNYDKTIEVFSPLGKYNFLMNPDKLNVEMKTLIDGAGGDYWGEMTVFFEAVEIVR